MVPATLKCSILLLPATPPCPFLLCLTSSLFLSFSPLPAAALQHLKRKKRLEKQLQNIDGTLSTIEFQREALENAQTNTEVFKNMKTAAQALKSAQQGLWVTCPVLPLTALINTHTSSLFTYPSPLFFPSSFLFIPQPHRLHIIAHIEVLALYVYKSSTLWKTLGLGSNFWLYQQILNSDSSNSEIDSDSSTLGYCGTSPFNRVVFLLCNRKTWRFCSKSKLSWF